MNRMASSDCAGVCRPNGDDLSASAAALNLKAPAFSEAPCLAPLLILSGTWMLIGTSDKVYTTAQRPRAQNLPPPQLLGTFLGFLAPSPSCRPPATKRQRWFGDLTASLAWRPKGVMPYLGTWTWKASGNAQAPCDSLRLLWRTSTAVLALGPEARLSEWTKLSVGCRKQLSFTRKRACSGLPCSRGRSSTWPQQKHEQAS